MSYTDHFRLVDDVSAHFDGAVAAVDPALKSRYTGFYAVTSAAVLELALKEIIIGFAQANNSLFGGYVASRYERINGRISLDDFHREHLKPFGEKYRIGFKNRLACIEQYFLLRKGISVKASYLNLLTCRHTFAHEGTVPTTATYEEMKQGFEAGKIVMSCLSRALTYR